MSRWDRPPTNFYACDTCGGPICQSIITGRHNETDHLVHLQQSDWADNVHAAVIRRGSGYYVSEGVRVPLSQEVW